MNDPNAISIVVNGDAMEADKAWTVTELLNQLGVPKRGIAVEINQEIVPATDFDAFTLNQDDNLEIVTLVGGG